jgi:16S rRNA (cytosine1402-N4)-methyltransferase
VPVCHTGGRGFEPRQPRLNPPRGTSHRAPSATAGGVFVFSEGAPTVTYHVPVLAAAVRAWAEGGRRAVDATVGGGGHAALLRAAGAEVLAVDRDPEAIAAARARLGEDGIRYSTGPFASAKVLGTVQTFRPDRILLDLGVASHQLDSDARGFTFRRGATLDMRMAAGLGVTAADIVNTWPAERLATTFGELADEPRARRLARAIVRRRATAPLRTSDDLVNAIREARGARSGPGDFARLFQALRIVVNQELEQLELGLPALRAALVAGGRLAVITYHSGEDRIVKHTFREWSKSCICPPGQPVCTCRARPLGRLLTTKPVRPEPAEIRDNPRARSARFRAFEVGGGA